MPDVRLAKLRHGGIQIIALPFPAQQHFGDPFRLQLRPDVSQRRWQPALISERRLRPGEERIALRGNSSNTNSLVTGDAVERHERLVDELLVIKLQLFRVGQRLGDPSALFRTQIEARPWAGRFAEASTARIELRKGGAGSGWDAEIVMAIGAAEIPESFPATRCESSIHLERLEGRDGLLGNRQNRRGDWSTRKLRTL